MGDSRSDSPTGRAPFSRLTPEQCARIHEASLQILERGGARLFEPEAVELLREAGAAVSGGNRVRVPRDLVEEALRSAPKELLLYDRNGRPAGLPGTAFSDIMCPTNVAVRRSPTGWGLL